MERVRRDNLWQAGGPQTPLEPQGATENLSGTMASLLPIRLTGQTRLGPFIGGYTLLPTP